MKKLSKIIAVGFVAALAAFTLAACGGEDDKVIKVGASPAPHAEILAQVEDALAEEGYTLEIVEFSDYVQPNVALDEGELDANYFQHWPYLDNFNAENGTDLVSAAAIHFEPLSIYPGKTSSLDALPNGAQIAIPSDATNGARALLLLEAEGIITLKDGVGLSATKLDIVDNPKNIEIIEAEAASLPRMLTDVDLAVINGNYALSAELDTASALASEDAASTAAQEYANIIAVRADDVDSAKTQALVAALQSDAVKNYIASTYNGVVVATF